MLDGAKALVLHKRRMQYSYAKPTAHAPCSTLDNLLKKLGAKQKGKQQHH